MEKEVKLFDKRFVYFVWDDMLAGKEVFASNDIYSLMDCVNNGGEIEGLVKEYGYSNCPFITVIGNRVYKFVYYDPNYEVKRAYFKEGKKVQYKTIDAKNWCDLISDIGLNEPYLWNDNFEWRIKPECPSCRPFKDCDELVKFWTEKYQSVARPANTMPLIWIRKKEGPRRAVKERNVCLITGFDNDTGGWGACVFLEDVWIDLKELFEDYEFLDKKPCGVEVKE